MTHYFNLFVIVPTAIISGSDEYHTPEGNSIVLFCKIENVSTGCVNNTYEHVLICYIIYKLFNVWHKTQGYIPRLIDTIYYWINIIKII